MKKKQVLAMTMQTASNPFGGVAPACLLRKFQDLSKEYTHSIRKIFAIPFEDIHLEDLQQLESIASELYALAQMFREVGNRLNPFIALENKKTDYEHIDWITLHDYQEMVDFYLNVALPKFPHQDFYGWLCHDMIDEAHRLLGVSAFLRIATQQQKLNSQTYQEMTNTASLWKFEAVVDAAAEFERQQFGEVDYEQR